MTTDSNSKSAIPQITRDDEEAGSGDLARENIVRLKALFPQIVADGRVDFDVLRQLLGDEVDEGEEQYGLNWKGKRRARAFAMTPSLGTLLPAPEDSVDWETTQNIMIEGDNLEVLKLLRRSYGGAVKFVYLDPPYNTGGDFVYPDDYSNSLNNYLEQTGQKNFNGVPLTSKREEQGRFHTDWLNMMYPRLLMAKEVLDPRSGIIAIQCDENEVANIVSLLEEVFGREFRKNILAIKMSHLSGMKMSHVDKKFPKIKEFVVVWSASEPNGIEPVYEACSWDEAFPRYTKWVLNPEDSPEDWQFSSLSAKIGNLEGGERESFLVENAHRIFRTAVNDGLSHTERDGKIRKVITTTGLERLALNGEEVIFAEKKIREIDGQRKPSSVKGDIWDDIGINNLHNEGGVEFANGKKPIKLIQRLIASLSGPDSIILDFFAGSGTTLHAIFAQNATDGGSRRGIIVQLPEIIPEKKEFRSMIKFLEDLKKPHNVAELTKQRLRISGAGIKSKKSDTDTGFRVYKLATSNLKPWQPNPDNLEASILDAVNNVLPDRSEEDLLVELLLKTGIDLTTPEEKCEIAGQSVHALGGGALMVCLGNIADEQVEDLGQGIANWVEELDPAQTTVYFKDSGIGSDGNRAATKANLAAILRQRLGDRIAKIASI